MHDRVLLKTLTETSTRHRMHELRQQTADVQIDRHHRYSSKSRVRFLFETAVCSMTLSVQKRNK